MSLEGNALNSTPSRWEALDVAARRGWSLLITPFLAERDRWPLWLPVLTGTGGVIYFASAIDVQISPLIVAIFGVVLALAGLRRHPVPFLLLLAVLALLAGLAAASLRARLVAAPVLERPISMALVSGTVADVEPLEHDAVRVVLTRLEFENRSLHAMPERVRLRLPPKSPLVRPGMRIRLFASLMPPSGPVLPGGFDFARSAWFQKLGGVGYGMGKVEILQETPPSSGWLEDVQREIASLRLSITQSILNQLPGDTGAVAAALVTGGERAISKPLLDAYRDSGLAHLLSVSGLHMSLVAGLVFVGLRAMLALIGPIALRFPIKKWTAVGAALAALFYLFLSGAFVPTQRSFLMTGIVLLGVVLDRQAISMRLVAWAALVILLTQPESLVGASFQMSFAAVLALVAVYELAQAPVSAWRRQGGWWRGFVIYVGMLALSSLVAGLATAPFSVDNFNRFNPYGVVSNMLAVPLSGVLVMPAALVSVLAMPFGLDHYPLLVYGWGCALVNLIAYWVASWPGAGLAVPSFPSDGYLALLLGGLWLLLMRTRWRLLGLLGIAYGLASLLWVRPPDLLVDGGNGLIALRLDTGRMLISAGKKDPITREAWKRKLAAQDEPEAIADGAGDGLLHCDGVACLAEMKGVSVALARRPEALLETCDAAQLIIADFALPRDACPTAQIIDLRARKKNGAYAVWLQDSAVARIETVKGQRLAHPWELPNSQRRTPPTDAMDLPEGPSQPAIAPQEGEGSEADTDNAPPPIPQ
jgi:competence protein ComEC